MGPVVWVLLETVAYFVFSQISVSAAFELKSLHFRCFRIEPQQEFVCFKENTMCQEMRSMI